MKPTHDPEHRGNAPAYWTGKTCIEKGCENPAGTAWSPLWCQTHNAERMDRIDAGFATILKQFEASQ